MTIIGSGDFRYKEVDEWPRLPRHWKFGDATDVSVNSKGEIYVLDRGKHPVTLCTPGGDFITSWGEGAFTPFIHGIFVAPNDNVWLADANGHFVSEFTPDGTPVKTLGTRGRPGVAYLGTPFNMPTGVAMSSNGDVFVSDGYGNHRVHKFNAKGELLLSWGREGTGPGEFANVHYIAIDKQDRVYICDRENQRIQVFDTQGKFITQWTGIEYPQTIYIRDNLAYIAEAPLAKNTSFSIRSLEGKQLMRWFPKDGSIQGGHGICVDSMGTIYLSEIMFAHKVHKYVRI